MNFAMSFKKLSEGFLKVGLMLFLGVGLFLIAGVLSSCTSSNAKTPCQNYGLFCSKTPINSWSSK